MRQRAGVRVGGLAVAAWLSACGTGSGADRGGDASLVSSDAGAMRLSDGRAAVDDASPGATLDASGDGAGTATPDVAAPAEERDLPLPPGTVRVASARMHTCAWRVSGAASCWGANDHGQLGDGTQVERHAPVPVTAFGPILQIAVGGAGGATDGHTCAIDGMHQVWCWGANTHGQLGDGTTVDESAPTMVQALQGDIEEIAAGGSHSCARRTNGHVVCWGANGSGQLGNGSSQDSPVPFEVPGLGDAVGLRAGYSHTCALHASGTIACWGPNAYGELGDGTGTTTLLPTEVVGIQDAVEVAAGSWHSCTRRAGGQLLCWGHNEYGDLGDGTQMQRGTPSPTLGLPTDVVEIATATAACARRAQGSVSCWGSGVVGQLGDGDGGFALTATGVVGLTDAVQVGGTCAVRKDDSIVCWGPNEHGQVGDGTTMNRFIPVQVSGFP